MLLELHKLGQAAHWGLPQQESCVGNNEELNRMHIEKNNEYPQDIRPLKVEGA
jgi:hypothetical protein